MPTEKPTLTRVEDEPTRAEVNAQPPDMSEYLERTRRFFRNRQLKNRRPRYAIGADGIDTDRNLEDLA
jgi:hypothetical protein